MTPKTKTINLMLPFPLFSSLSPSLFLSYSWKRNQKPEILSHENINLKPSSHSHSFTLPKNKTKNHTHLIHYSPVQHTHKKKKTLFIQITPQNTHSTNLSVLQGLHHGLIIRGSTTPTTLYHKTSSTTITFHSSTTTSRIITGTTTTTKPLWIPEASRLEHLLPVPAQPQAPIDVSTVQWSTRHWILEVPGPVWQNQGPHIRVSPFRTPEPSCTLRLSSQTSVGQSWRPYRTTQGGLQRKWWPSWV